MAFSFSSVNALTQEERFRDDWWVTVGNYANTLKNQSLMQVITKVKGPIKLPKFSATATWQDGDGCGFSASGNDTITQATLTPGRVKINKTWCVQDLETYFTQGGLPIGQGYDNLGPIENMVLTETMTVSGNTLEGKLWKATTSGGADKFDGLATIAKASGPSATSTGSLSASNTLGYVEGLVNDAMNDTDQTMANMCLNGGITIWMGNDAFRFYDLDYRTTYGTYIHANQMGDKMVQGTNVKIVPVAGLTGTNEMYMIPDKNAVIATDLLADTSTIKTGMDQYEENIWGKVRFMIGTGFRDVSFMKRHAAS